MLRSNSSSATPSADGELLRRHRLTRGGEAGELAQELLDLGFSAGLVTAAGQDPPRVPLHQLDGLLVLVLDAQPVHFGHVELVEELLRLGLERPRVASWVTSRIPSWSTRAMIR